MIYSLYYLHIRMASSVSLVLLMKLSRLMKNPKTTKIFKFPPKK